MRALALLLALCAATSAHAQRPQLDAAEAKRYAIADYLGDWQPQAIAFDGKPDFTVGPGGTHRTVQAALDALPAKSDHRLRILVKPGTYRETVCIKDRAPFLLYGEGGDAAKTVILDGHYNAEPKAPGTPANPCEPVLNAASWGTYGSASFAVFSNDAQFANLTIANDAMDKVRDGQGYPTSVSEAGGAQAVAFMSKGDRIQLQNVRLVGHQDTFFVRGPGRVYVDRSFISGDVDFIFGSATLVINDSTILSRYGRRAPGSGGYLLAPSTPAANERGFLVTRSRLIGEPGLEPGSIRLGRAWDEGVPKGEWKANASPNGQALVRDSELGPHLGTVGAGWGNSTSRRPFAASGPQANRFFEYRNALNIDREVLGPKNGWAAAEGGTRGGADASAQHVFDVYKRSELVAAFALGNTPKIIRIHGLIDFNRDEQGRRVVPASFADKEWNWDEFLKAYDPATWGRKDPIGPPEGARKRSSKRQAEWMQLRVPSNSTLIGVADGDQVAGLNGGSLFLDGVDNVIIRRLRITDAYDFFPEWQPRDNGHGEWNSEYDAITLRAATHVWIDHCTFNDGDRPDQAEPLAFGQRIQHHDGLVDITRGSDLVTVSWNVFSQHDKTMLIGGSDSAKAYDDGHLRVTLHHNLWEQLMERTPRVRFGQAHVYNNLFVARADAANSGYGYHYSLGLGIESRLFTEANAWDASPGIGPEKLTRALKGTRLFDRGNNLLNGQPVDLLAGLRLANPDQSFSADVGWAPTLHEPMDSPEDLASRVRAGAGVRGIGGQ